MHTPDQLPLVAQGPENNQSIFQKTGEAALRTAMRHPKIAGAVTAFYAISPVDLAPDVLPPVTWTDDLIIIAAGLYALHQSHKAKKLDNPAHSQNLASY